MCVVVVSVCNTAVAPVLLFVVSVCMSPVILVNRWTTVVYVLVVLFFSAIVLSIIPIYSIGWSILLMVLCCSVISY